MTSTPSPRSTPAPRSADTSPRSQAITATTNLPDRSVPSWTLDGAASDSKNASFIPAWRRPTLNTQGGDDPARRPSVQFVPNSKDKVVARSSSARPAGAPGKAGDSRRGTTGGPGRRMSSPPPPAQFRPSVSFDTFANKEASDFSLTLGRKHRDYEYTKRSRTFLVGTDTNDYSDTALEWLLDELVDDGDEVVCLRVVEKDSREAARMGEKGYRDEAERFLEAIERKNTDDRAISLVLEFSIGKVQEAIQQMIKIYEPAMLVVGTRGRSLTGYQGLLSSGSVSKYCLQYSPVPVIVVRPSSKRESKKKKRLRDPERRGYRDILDKSEDAPRGRGGHLLDERNRMSVMGGPLGMLEDQGDPDEEARRVAEAIGYRNQLRQQGPGSRGSSLSRTATNTSHPDDEPVTSPNPTERVLRSPELGYMDSDEEDESEDEVLQRPEDEAAQLAYERAMKVVEEEREEEEARREREERMSRRHGDGRSTSRGRVRGRDEEDEGGRGAGVLSMLAQLDRGMGK